MLEQLDDLYLPGRDFQPRPAPTVSPASVSTRRNRPDIIRSRHRATIR
jgi:hypothetical protein